MSLALARNLRAIWVSATTPIVELRFLRLESLVTTLSTGRNDFTKTLLTPLAISRSSCNKGWFNWKSNDNLDGIECQMRYFYCFGDFVHGSDCVWVVRISVFFYPFHIFKNKFLSKLNGRSVAISDGTGLRSVQFSKVEEGSNLAGWGNPHIVCYIEGMILSIL